MNIHVYSVGGRESGKRDGPAKTVVFCGLGLLVLRMIDLEISYYKPIIKASLTLPPQGFRPEISRRHSSNSRVKGKVLTVEIYSHTVNIEKILFEQGPRGIGR